MNMFILHAIGCGLIALVAYRQGLTDGERTGARKGIAGTLYYVNRTLKNAGINVSFSPNQDQEP